VTYSLAALDQSAINASIGQGNAPSSSDWQNAYTAVQKLAAEAPSTVLPGDGTDSVRDLVNTLAGDVSDIASNGYESSNGGANLQGDNGRVQADAQQLNCPNPH
jgi:hypothetical protein